ncbi:MAG TPA: enoyl-CoA hydratase-related protein [Stellaceae bacterium]|nr:enoyl-CoA hydratase-related protein [Stellaceae bacterium]
MRTLKVGRKEGVFEICLDRPEILNAANREMIEELAAATAEAAADKQARAVLLRGAGSHFMAGGDIRMFGTVIDLPPEERRRTFLGLVDLLHPSLAALRGMPKPVVAAVQGAAAGVGLSLVLAADLALAAEDAVFAFGYIHLGTSPDGAASWSLPRIVGLKRAAELMLLGERFDARRAAELGIVNRLVPPEKLAAEALALARRLAAGPTAAYARTKALIQASIGDGLAEQMQREAESFAACAATEDFAEGVRAFLEKRPASFNGVGA